MQKAGLLATSSCLVVNTLEITQFKGDRSFYPRLFVGWAKGGTLLALGFREYLKVIVRIRTALQTTYLLLLAVASARLSLRLLPIALYCYIC